MFEYESDCFSLVLLEFGLDMRKVMSNGITQIALSKLNTAKFLIQVLEQRQPQSAKEYMVDIRNSAHKQGATLNTLSTDVKTLDWEHEVEMLRQFIVDDKYKQF